MVCFELLIAYPLRSWEYSNTVFEQRIRHLRRHYNADEKNCFVVGGTRYLLLTVCNEDAIDFLRDVPEPVYCLWIRIRNQPNYMYANYKATGKWIVPPKELLLKRVYWTASSLEKWQPKITPIPASKLPESR